MQSLIIGSVVVDKAELERLSSCSFAKRVSVRNGVPFCLCSLGSGCCLSNGKCLKFKHLYDGFHIVWVCSRVVVLPNLER
jgi:hypothetical protein